MKRDAAKTTTVESGKRQRQNEQEEAFNQDRAEIYKLLDAQNESGLKQHHNEGGNNLFDDHDSSLNQAVKNPDENRISKIETQNVSRFEDSSDEEDENVDKKWLAPPKDGRTRRTSRIGDNYQAVLPSSRGE